MYLSHPWCCATSALDTYVSLASLVLRNIAAASSLVLQSDFILTAADVVTNMDLAPALEAHRSRRKTDKSCLMTVVCRGKVSAEQRIRMGIEPQR